METDARITRLEQKVSEMDSRLTSRIAEMDKSIAVSNSFLERYFVIQEKLSTAIDNLSASSHEIRIAMAAMQGEIKVFGVNMNELKTQFLDADKARQEEAIALKQKISDVELRAIERINTVDEKGKLDWSSLFKKALENMIMLFIGGGLMAIILIVIGKMK